MKWVETAGARVVPIIAGLEGSDHEEYLDQMFHGINGILLPGGGSSIHNSTYAYSTNYLYDLAVRVSF